MPARNLGRRKPHYRIWNRKSTGLHLRRGGHGKQCKIPACLCSCLQKPDGLLPWRKHYVYVIHVNVQPRRRSPRGPVAHLPQTRSETPSRRSPALRKQGPQKVKQSGIAKKIQRSPIAKFRKAHLQRAEEMLRDCMHKEAGLSVLQR